MDKTRRAFEEVMNKPRLYVKLLSKLFLMKDAAGRQFPYKPTPEQAEWHKHAWVANPSPPDSERNRIWTKCRGIGATATTMMDQLITGIVYDDITIPVSSISAAQAKRGPIKWGLWFCDNPPDQSYKIYRDEQVESEIRLKDTKSVIHLIPGSNPRSMRTIRSPSWFSDEHDWLENPKDLYDAGKNVVSEGGQITVVSTIKNINGHFMDIITHAKERGFWVHNTPAFDTDAFDPMRGIQEQIDTGLIRPIAPWLNIPNLQEQINEDLSIFYRENMCKAPDEGVNFLSWDLINEMCVLEWEGDLYKKWGIQYITDDDTGIRTRSKVMARPEGNFNPWIAGWDYARFRDLFVCHVYEHTEFGAILRYEHVGRGSDTPSQNALLELITDLYRLDEIRIDMTGPGIGFYDVAYKKLGAKAQGISFARTMESREDPDIMVPIKAMFALNLRRRGQAGTVKLFNEKQMKADLNIIPYDLTNISKTRAGSHGDRFWASTLGVYPPTYNSPYAFFG